MGKDERKVGAVLWQRSRLQKRALNLGIRSHCLQQKAGSTIGLNSHSSPVLLWHPPATYGNAHVAAHHCGPQGGKAWWRAVTPALAGTIGGSRPEQWNRCAGAEINRCAGKQDIRSTQKATAMVHSDRDDRCGDVSKQQGKYNRALLLAHSCPRL